MLVKEEIVRTIISLYSEFEMDIVKAEKEGRGNYTDSTFNFDNFIRWLREKHGEENITRC